MCSIIKLPAKLDYKNTPGQHSTNPQKEKEKKKRKGADALCKATFSLHFNENTVSSIPVYHTRSYSAPQTSPPYTIIERPIFSPSFQEYLKISKLLTTTKLDE